METHAPRPWSRCRHRLRDHGRHSARADPRTTRGPPRRPLRARRHALPTKCERADAPSKAPRPPDTAILLAVPPDGRRLVYAGVNRGTAGRELLLRELATGQTTSLLGSTDASWPTRPRSAPSLTSVASSCISLGWDICACLRPRHFRGDSRPHGRHRYGCDPSSPGCRMLRVRPQETPCPRR